MMRPSRRRTVPAAVAVLLLAGCNSRTPSMLDPRSGEAGHISHLWWLMFGLATAVYIVVMVIVGIAMVRRRARGTDLDAMATDAIDVDVDERTDHRFLLYGGLLVPTLVLAVVAVQTVRVSNSLEAAPAAVKIEVVGEQWWWRVTYPNDGVVTANEIHVPVGEPVELTLTSDNVIHSFWVPQLNGKTDLIPGRTNAMSFTADVAGEYRGLCAEFCGIQHAHMGFVIVAQAPAEYGQWLDGQRGPAVGARTDQQRYGYQLVTGLSCAGCHNVSGTPAEGTLGPDLSHVASRRALASETLPNTPDDMRRWLSSTQVVKHGALMPQIDLTNDELDALVAYLEALR